MIQFNLKNKNYILIEIPSDALDDRWFIIYNVKKDSFYVEFQKDKESEYIPLNTSQDCYILGKLSEVLQNEKLCSEIVEQHNSFFWKVPRFYNYLKYPKANINELTRSIPMKIYLSFSNATDSFKSFLQSINVDMSKEYLLIIKQ